MGILLLQIDNQPRFDINKGLIDLISKTKFVFEGKNLSAKLKYLEYLLLKNQKSLSPFQNTSVFQDVVVEEISEEF